MKKLILILTLLTSPALAQEQVLTFQIPISMANTIIRALNELPYKDSVVVIAELQKQAQAQLQKPKE